MSPLHPLRVARTQNRDRGRKTSPGNRQSGYSRLTARGRCSSRPWQHEGSHGPRGSEGTAAGQEDHGQVQAGIAPGCRGHPWLASLLSQVRSGTSVSLRGSGPAQDTSGLPDTRTSEHALGCVLAIVHVRVLVVSGGPHLGPGWSGESQQLLGWSRGQDRVPEKTGNRRAERALSFSADKPQTARVTPTTPASFLPQWKLGLVRP